MPLIDTLRPLLALTHLSPGRATGSIHQPTIEHTPLDRALLWALRASARVAGYRVVIGAPRVHQRQVLAAVNGELPVIPPDLQHVADRYARQETILVAYHRGRPVGAMSLFTPDAQCRTLEAWPAALPAGVDRERVVDIGRLAIARGHRGGARFALLCLFDAAQQFSARHDRPYWIGVTSPGLVRVFGRLNPTVRPLPPADRPAGDADVRRYWAAYRVRSDAALATFILRIDASLPSVVLPRHAAELLAQRQA